MLNWRLWHGEAVGEPIRRGASVGGNIWLSLPGPKFEI